MGYARPAGIVIGRARRFPYHYYLALLGDARQFHWHQPFEPAAKNSERSPRFVNLLVGGSPLVREHGSPKCGKWQAILQQFWQSGYRSGQYQVILLAMEGLAAQFLRPPVNGRCSLQF